MLKTAAITLFTLFLSACVPIPQEPSQAVCHEGFVVMRAGQSASDPIVSDLPGHVDIVKPKPVWKAKLLPPRSTSKMCLKRWGFNREGMPVLHI